MKKVAFILLLCIYATATMGFSLKEFYCCGKLKSVTLTLTAAEKNNSTDTCSKNNCCQNKFHFHKVKDNHVAATVSIDFFDSLLYIARHNYCNDISPYSSVIYEAENIHSPPPLTGEAVYITNCVFLI